METDNVTGSTHKRKHDNGFQRAEAARAGEITVKERDVQDNWGGFVAGSVEESNGWEE